MTTAEKAIAASDDEMAERGRTTISAQAVERIAGAVATRCVAVGGTGNRVLGITVSSASEDGAADVTVRLHGQRAVSLDVRCSVPYPNSVRQATAVLRQELTERVAELVGMTVRRVDIAVTALTTTTGRRVR